MIKKILAIVLLGCGFVLSGASQQDELLGPWSDISIDGTPERFIPILVCNDEEVAAKTAAYSFWLEQNFKHEKKNQKGIWEPVERPKIVWNGKRYVFAPVVVKTVMAPAASHWDVLDNFNVSGMTAEQQVKVAMAASKKKREEEEAKKKAVDLQVPGASIVVTSSSSASSSSSSASVGSTSSSSSSSQTSQQQSSAACAAAAATAASAAAKK